MASFTTPEVVPPFRRYPLQRRNDVLNSEVSVIITATVHLCRHIFQTCDVKTFPVDAGWSDNLALSMVSAGCQPIVVLSGIVPLYFSGRAQADTPNVVIIRRGRALDSLRRAETGT
jgi:hypothetical protein